MKKSDELKQENADLLDAAKAMIDKAEAAGRDLSAAERKQFDELMKKVDANNIEIDDALTEECNRAACAPAS